MRRQMTNKRAQRYSRRMPHGSARLRLARRFVGVWRQVPNSFDTSTVAYSVTLRDRRIVISGVDESDGVELEVFDPIIRRRELRFTSYFPPTKHTAGHIWRLLGKRWALHQVRYKYRGSYYGGDEVWEKAR